MCHCKLFTAPLGMYLLELSKWKKANPRIVAEQRSMPFTHKELGSTFYPKRNSFSTYSSQCAPGFSNPNQKFHGLFHFYIVGIYKTDQNQLKKPSVIRFPKQ